jgi:hypothetical protein
MRGAIAAAGIATLLLSGCTAQQAQQAAVSDEFSISQADVDAEVRAVLEALGQPPGEPPAELALATTQRLVQDALFAAKAADMGIEITQGQVEEGLAQMAAERGGREALEQAALQAGIPAAGVADFVRTNLIFSAISDELGAAAGDQAVGMAALSEYSEAIDVRVAPRYGTWDDSTLQIVTGSSVVEPAQPAAS